MTDGNQKKSSGWYRAGSATVRQVNCVEHLMADGWLDGSELDFEERQYIGLLSANRASKLIALGYKRRDAAKTRSDATPPRPPHVSADSSCADVVGWLDD